MRTRACLNTIALVGLAAFFSALPLIGCGSSESNDGNAGGESGSAGTEAGTGGAAGKGGGFGKGGASGTAGTGGTAGKGGSAGSAGAGGAAGGGGTSGAGGTSCSPTTEACDGKDNDCDGEVDEGCDCTNGQVQDCYAGPSGTQGIGVCMAGKQTCVSGKFGTCAGAVLPSEELCNGLDDDCDGESDEGFAEVVCGLGACQVKVAGCESGEIPACVPLQPAAAEVCDGAVDDDCDGTVDDGCECTTGQVIPCYSGPDGTSGVGVCKGGEQACVGGVWASCQNEVKPLDEVCNGADDDCDGETDEGLGTLSCGVGACATTVTACVAGQTGSCNPLPPAAQESCDGTVDDDCDGVVDNGCACTDGTSQACYTAAPGTLGVGVCKAGEQTCTSGAWGKCDGEVTPAVESCDGTDDDCDGQVDEELGNVSCGVGACFREMAACAEGKPVACVPLPPGDDELCDGIVDDDCDGQVDEGCTCTNGQTQSCYTGPVGTLGKGVCATGTSSCGGGSWGACVGEVVPSDEVCNGKDDDCDNVADDGLGTITCGQGICQATVSACVDGEPQNCVPGTPGQEACNSLDDDCDGVTDNNEAAKSCALAHAIAKCSAGSCEVDSCFSGYGNCDNVQLTGCETDLQTDPQNCGACGAQCGAGESCYGGKCAVTCANAAPTFPVQGCTNVAAYKPATASSNWGWTIGGANDGNACTMWNAGSHPPAWWAVDLGSPTLIRGVTLVPNMSPSPAAVSHLVELSDDGVTWTTKQTIAQTMTSQQPYPIDFGVPVLARHVRIQTTSTPSWVAWAEVAVYSCQ